MAWLSGNKIAWTYTDEFGTTYLVRGTKAITDQVDGNSDPLVGGSATNATTYDVLPKTIYRMRAVKCVSAGFPDKWVPVYSDDAPLLTPATTINLNSGTDSHSYASTNKRRGEAYRKHPAIAQTT